MNLLLGGLGGHQPIFHYPVPKTTKIIGKLEKPKQKLEYIGKSLEKIEKPKQFQLFQLNVKNCLGFQIFPMIFHWKN